jgi:outer membrane autotransporter protein
MFTTNATVQTGLLRVNGELDTPLLTVSNYAGLGGTGTIFGIVDNHGYFAPGNSIGSVTIIGSMTNWGDYNVQIDAAGNSDHIAVSDTATIMGGTVVAQPVERKIYSNTVYTILTATNGVNGTYDTSRIEYSFWPYTNLFLSSWLSYDENNAYLNLHRAKFTSVANTYNQTAVAGALDGIVDSPGPGMSNLVCEFFWLPSAPDARKALDSMSGEIHGTLGMLDMQQQDAFNRSVSLRTGRISSGGEGGGYASMMPLQLADAGSTLPPMPPKANQSWDIWMQGFGSFGHLDGDGNASGGRFNISGMNGGVDYRLRPELLVGLAMGYSYDDASVGGPGADGNVNAIQIAGYGGYVNGPWHLDGILSYGFLSTDTKRYISVGSIHEMATANYDGGVLSLSAEGGYAYEASSRVTIEPTLGLIYTHVEQDSFSEKGIATDGNNYGLNVRSVDMDSFRTALGVRLDAKLGKKDGVQFIPELRVGWEHEFADRTADVTARFIGGSGDFIVRGVELGADSAALGAGLTVAFSKAIQGAVNYDARLNEQLTSHAISGRMSYSW